MLNADMLKQNYGTIFNTQIEYLSNNIAKKFNCNRISIATHDTIILDAYKEEKRFRPKIILKRSYNFSLLMKNHLKRLIFYH